MGGEDEQEDVGEVPPRLEAATGDDVCGQRQRPEILDRSARAPALTQRPPVAALVLAPQPSVEHPAHPCRHDQQRQHEGDREADPAHRRSGARRSGRRLSALLLTPKLPSAPSKASTAARRPATRSMSSTLARLLLPKKEIEEGAASTASAPTAGTRVAEMALISADSRRPAVEPCSCPIPL